MGAKESFILDPGKFVVGRSVGEMDDPILVFIPVNLRVGRVIREQEEKGQEHG
jgi:hypothetical protein